MKRFSFSAVALAVVLLLSPAHVRAQEDQAGRRTAAEELLKAMHTEQLLGGVTKRMDSVVDRFTEASGKQTDLSEEQIAANKKAQEEARETVRTQLSWDALKGDAIQAYADAFTVPELQQLTAFYQTPVGQKYVDLQAAISEKLTKTTQQRLMAVMPVVIQKLRDAARKSGGKPEGAPLGPVVPPPAAPAIPRVPAAPAAPAPPVVPTVPATPATPAPANAAPPAPPVPTPPPASPATTPAA